MRKLGGVVWRIVGRGGIAGSHESEAGCGKPDMDIRNTHGIDRLPQLLDNALLKNVAVAA
ncbi:hypothetical protein D3C71_2242970 [compost metagenome]